MPAAENGAVVAFDLVRKKRGRGRLGGEEIVAVVEIKNLQVGSKRLPPRQDEVRSRTDRAGGGKDGGKVKHDPEIHGPPREPVPWRPARTRPSPLAPARVLAGSAATALSAVSSHSPPPGPSTPTPWSSCTFGDAVVEIAA